MPLGESSQFLGILGIVITIIFSIAGMQRKKLSYRIFSTPLLTNEEYIFALQQLIDKEEIDIENLTLSTIEFKNCGNTVIENSDFVTTAPLKIRTNGKFYNILTFPTKFLGETIFVDDMDYNIFIEYIDIHNTAITFEFIRPNGFFCFSVMHDGELSVSGKLKSGSIRKLKVYNARSIRNFCIVIVCSALLQFLILSLHILSDVFILPISILTTFIIVLSAVQINRICANKWSGYNLQSIQDRIVRSMEE